MGDGEPREPGSSACGNADGAGWLGHPVPQVAGSGGCGAFLPDARVMPVRITDAGGKWPGAGLGRGLG